MALSDLFRCAERLAHSYRDAAKVAGDDALSELFTTLADRRRAMAERARGELERLDDVPSEPDPDLEDFHALIRHLWARVSSHSDDHLVREQSKREQELRALVEDSLSAPGLPRSTIVWLNREKEGLARVAQTLSQTGDEVEAS